MRFTTLLLIALLIAGCGSPKPIILTVTNKSFDKFGRLVIHTEGSGKFNCYREYYNKIEIGKRYGFTISHDIDGTPYCKPVCIENPQ